MLNLIDQVSLIACLQTITDRIIEARSFLLEELFNKFSGPLDLAASIGVSKS